MKMFLLGEAGVNHEGSLDRALDLVEAVAMAGWDAIKFQTYRSKSIAASDSPSYWDLREEPINNQRSLFNKYEKFDLEWYKPIIKHCNRHSIGFMTSLFDPELVDIFDDYVEMHKISSSDLTNYQLINKIAEKRKPIILSTGASTLSEVKKSLAILKQAGTDPRSVTLLHCVLNYPTTLENANLSRITSLRNEFKSTVGYSCHVKDIEACVTAHALGASFIEKHITLTPFKKGNDHYHALSFHQMKELKVRLRRAEEMLGTGLDEIESQMTARKNARRGLYYTAAFKKGHLLDSSSFIALRPTHEGCKAEDIELLIGKTLLKDVALESQVKPTDF